MAATKIQLNDILVSPPRPCILKGDSSRTMPDIFYQSGLDAGLCRAYRDASAWQIQRLGGHLLPDCAPGPVCCAPGRLDVFAIAADAKLYQWTPTAGNNATLLGPGLVLSGADVCSFSDSRLDLFEIGRGGKLIHGSYEPNRGWLWDTDLGGQYDRQNPASVSWTDGTMTRIDVFCVNTEQKLVHSYYLNSWVPNRALKTPALLTGAPSACLWGRGNTETKVPVFIRCTTGTFWGWYEYGQESGGNTPTIDWQPLVIDALSTVGAVFTSKTNIEVYFRGLDSGLYVLQL